MDDNTGIRGRSKEISKIKQFIETKIENDQAGILYIAGPPGTGKTMSVRYVLSQFKRITNININCMKALSSKVILRDICKSVGLTKNSGERSKEQDMLIALKARFSSRKPFILVLDEMDHIPKSQNTDLIRKIFSWPSQEGSKLILIGIANTLNLTSRCEIVSSVMGSGAYDITKMTFKPYTTQEIKSILEWYLENDENFEDANLGPKVLDMLAAKFCREKNGDIRGALNALKSTIEDTVNSNKLISIKESSRNEISELSTTLITPPSSPLTPRKERSTNIPSMAESIKKRQRRSIYVDDEIPLTHQILVGCIQKLHLKRKSLVEVKDCKKLAIKVLDEFKFRNISDNDFRQILTHLENQGWIVLKRVSMKQKIGLKPGFENEVSDLVKEKDNIMCIIDKFCP